MSLLNLLKYNKIPEQNKLTPLFPSEHSPEARSFAAEEAHCSRPPRHVAPPGLHTPSSGRRTCCWPPGTPRAVTTARTSTVEPAHPKLPLRPADETCSN